MTRGARAALLLVLAALLAGCTTAAPQPPARDRTSVIMRYPAASAVPGSLRIRSQRYTKSSAAMGAFDVQDASRFSS